MARTLAALIQVKHQFFDMLSSVHKEYLAIESCLEDTSLEKESLKIQNLVDTYGKLKGTSLILKEEMTSLVKEVNKEKSRPSRHKEMMAEMIRTIQLPENGFGVITSEEDFPSTAMARSLLPYCPLLRS